MKSLALKVLLVVTGIVLVGCPQRYEWSCPPLAMNDGKSEGEPDKTFIQIDGTPSMQGFVSSRDSRYIRTLRLLDSAMGTAFPASPSPAYYRFGTQRFPMKEMTSPLLAESAGFYSGSIKELRDAQTEKIIEPLDDNASDDVYVIVTDLYQKDAQWEALAKRLKDFYLLKDNHAVGILGVKSQFYGTVYDVGLEDLDIENQRGEHPFYVIVLGNYSNVKRYFDAIKLGSKNAGLNLPDENFVIFSTRLLQKPAVLNIQGKQPIVASSKDSPTPPQKGTKSKQSELSTPRKVNLQALGVQRVKVVNDGQVMVNVKTEGLTSVERLKITDKSPMEIKLRYEVSYAKLPYVLPLNTHLDYQIDPEKSDFSERRKKFSKLDKPILSLENWQFPGGDNLSFDAAFNFDSGTQSKGVYRLVVDIFPGQFSGNSKPYASPSWWRNWNFGENDPFSVSQTYNLQPFLEGLAETTFGIIEKKPNSAVGRLCFIIQKD